MVQFDAYGNTPFTAKKIPQKGYYAIMASGKYMEFFKECWIKGPDDKTWENFKTFFER